MIGYVSFFACGTIQAIGFELISHLLFRSIANDLENEKRKNKSSEIRKHHRKSTAQTINLVSISFCFLSNEYGSWIVVKKNQRLLWSNGLNELGLLNWTGNNIFNSTGDNIIISSSSLLQTLSRDADEDERLWNETNKLIIVSKMENN